MLVLTGGVVLPKDRCHMTEQFITLKTAAEKLGIAKKTLARWLAAGFDVPHVRVGNMIAFDEKALSQFIADRIKAKK
jgi:excisionase family DNA binding protein